MKTNKMAELKMMLESLREDTAKIKTDSATLKNYVYGKLIGIDYAISYIELVDKQ